MQSQAKWQSLIEPILEGTPYELIGVVCSGGTRGTLVRIYIDKPGGITIDEIASLSREISVVLDVHEPIAGNYTLEVSSPGLDRPLFIPRHFKEQIGKMVSLKTQMLHENRQHFKGILMDANDKEVTLRLEDNTLRTLAYDDIDKAKLVYVHAEIKGKKDE